MRLLRSLLVILLFTIPSAWAQEPEATPAPTPQITATPHEVGGQTQTASPTPTVSPTPQGQEQPQLLPESKTLPTPPPEMPLPRDLIPEGAKPQLPGPAPYPNSAEQMEKDRIRFRQIRTIAVRNPYAIYLLRRARAEDTDEMKREYLRVYYITMCDEMRKLEPRLKGVIDAFENVNIARLSPVAQRPTVPERGVPRFRALEEAAKIH
jgi:hypothetical protein